MATSIASLLQTLRIVPTAHKKLQSAAKPGQLVAAAAAAAAAATLPEITLYEVAEHDTYDDCWIVIYDRVYDVTRFLRTHPGGDDVIMDHAGRDATLAFHGTGHTRDAIDQMHEFLIGELPAEQRIFRNTTGRNKVLKLDVPE